MANYFSRIALKTSIFLCLATQLSCEPNDHIYTHPKVQNILRFGAAEDSKNPIWKGQGAALFLNGPAEKAFEKINKTNPVYMLTVDRHSQLDQKINEHGPEVLLSSPANEQSLGFALIQPKNDITLEAWAQLAHSQPGFGCGRMQLVTGTKLTQTTGHYNPVYREDFKIPGLETIGNAIDPQASFSSIEILESLGSRQFNSTNALAASNTVVNLLEAVLSQETQAEIERIDLETTDQQSIVVRWPGKKTPDEIVIVGAHLDSINRNDRTNAPGADDNATGVSSLVEIARIIDASSLSFDRTIELHAYAAEEVGLIGSTNLAQAYRTENKRVVAMLQLDMTGFTGSQEQPKIHLIETDTSSQLQLFFSSLAQTYLPKQYTSKPIKAGTSDHKAWFDAGFPAMFIFEDPDDFNQALHTANDTSSLLTDPVYRVLFIKTAFYYLAHYAGATNGAIEGEYEQLLADNKDAFIGNQNDISIAIINREADESVDIAVAAEGAFRVALCLTESVTDPRCSTSVPMELALAKTTDSGRTFFINNEGEGLTVSSGNLFYVRAFAESGTLLKSRVFRIGDKI